MRTTTARHTCAVLAVLALLLAACSGDDGVAEDPEQALTDAVRALAGYEGYDVTLRAQVDDAALAAMQEHGDLDEDEARLLASSSLRVQMLADGASDPSTAEAAFALAFDDAPAVELRLTGGDYFVRADAERFLTLVDDDDARAGFEGFVAEADELGFGELARAVQAGDWMQLVGLDQLVSMFSGMAGGLDPDSADTEELAGELGSILREFVAELEVAYVGSEEPGEHVRAVADAEATRRFLEAYFSAVFAAVPGAAAVPEEEMRQGIDEMVREVPDGLEIPVEAWISGGRLVRVAVDVVEVARANGGEAELPEGVSQLLVLADIAEFSGGVEAPPEPVRIDLFELFGRAMGGAFGSGMTELDDGAASGESLELDDLEELEELEVEETASGTVTATADAGGEEQGR